MLTHARVPNYPPTSLPPTSRCLSQALITVAFAAALPWLLRTAPGLLRAFPVTGGIPFLMHGLLMHINDGWIVSEERRRKSNSRFSHNVPLLSLYNIFEVGGARVPLCMDEDHVHAVLQAPCSAAPVHGHVHACMAAPCCLLHCPESGPAVSENNPCCTYGEWPVTPMPLALMPRYIVVAGMASVA